MRKLLILLILLGGCSIQRDADKFCRKECARAIKCNKNLSVEPFNYNYTRAYFIQEGEVCICPIFVKVSKHKEEEK